jgi:Ca-activated chloride channel family protein
MQALRIMSAWGHPTDGFPAGRQPDEHLRQRDRRPGFLPAFLRRVPIDLRQHFQDSLRNQYSIGYEPSNKARDGKFRKIKVELVNPATNEPLRVTDEKGKPIKYQIVAKNGYTAPREVE